jgi:predicted transposase YbfD/YdcC
MEKANSLQAYFEELSDPRMEAKCDHLLLDIVSLSICATIAGSNDWQAIETFGKSKEKWLRQWLELPNGIPSHDTIERVFQKLDPEEFETCFIAWAGNMFKQMPDQVVAIDGKTLRGTAEKLHLVSAWASESGISLGHAKVDSKSNEITAIPELLKVLMLKGCIVTIDAMGCQKQIAQQIVDQEADYVLAVKGNQGTLHEYLQARFNFSDDSRFLNHEQPQYSETVERRNGQTETRRCWVFSDSEVVARGWANCQTIIRVTCERQTHGNLEHETRYFISTLSAQPATLLACVRAHWGIENSFHWVLDVVFKEDQARTQHETAALNLAVLRRIALNLIKRHPAKGSLKQKRYRAALNEDFLLEVVQS